MFGVGFQEVLVILVIVLVIFGPRKLPELARMIGKGLAEFRRATYDLKSAMDLDELTDISTIPGKNSGPKQIETSDPAREHVDDKAETVEEALRGEKNASGKPVGNAD